MSRIAFTVIALAGIAATASAADIIYETADPFGSPFGFIGFDVFTQQSVGVRFVPDQDYTLTSVSAWFMNNASVPLDRPVRLSVQTDQALGDAFIPSGDELEVMELFVTAIGWDPQFDTATASGDTVLNAGKAYWIVAESDYGPAENPVWNWATGVTGYTSTTAFDTGNWQPGGSGAVVGILVEGQPDLPCRPDLDGDGQLTIFDFLAFQNLFDAGDLQADFDGDRDLTIFDFLAFQNEFDTGCA
ncbi:MAG: GC-type dockerin domain-anchored protein [Phycisphaerales bacterium JB060]